MNGHDDTGKNLVERLAEYRNRAEELRARAETMHEESAEVIRSIAAGYDHVAETVQAILLRSAALPN
jgi:uncharacterized coiled-coil DUF342 family protein